MIGYPLDSHVTYKADGTPVFDRAISSAPLRKLTKNLFSDGVLPNPSTNMQVTATTGNTIKVLAGFALCNGCQKLQEIDMELALPASDASLDRIDTVVLRLDDNDDVRACEFYIVSGTPSSTPQAPALTRMGSIWELGLANIYRKTNSTEVTNANITDTRYDSDRCGIISSISEFDTTTLYQQIEADLREFKTINEAEFEAWFTNLKDVLSGDVAGELYNLINEVKGSVGNLEELKTSNKEDIVSAVNEVKDGLDNAKVDTLVSMEEVEATTDITTPVGAGAIKELNESLGDISNIGNKTYNSVEKLLQYYISNGYLPDVNIIPLIPILSADNSYILSSGAYAEGGNGGNYCAFDNNEATFFASSNYGNVQSHIGYDLQSEHTLKKYKLVGASQEGVATVYIQGSNNNSDWTNLTSAISLSTTPTKSEDIINASYRYVRVLKTGDTSSASRLYVNTFQVYGE